MAEDIEIRVVRLEEQHKAAHDARELQALEYARRLDELNHSHDKQVEIQRTYVSQAVYDEKHEALQARVSLLETWKANITGRAVAVATLGALFIATISGLIVHGIHW